jgi:hypothetical protein
MPKISVIIILTNVDHQDSFKSLGGIKGLPDCWDYFMIPLGDASDFAQNPCGLKDLGLFHDPFGGMLRTSLKTHAASPLGFLFCRSPLSKLE